MDSEERIRERAYLMWLEAGAPEDRAEEFWERAEADEKERAPNEYLRAVADGSF